EAGQDKMIGGICESPMTITALLAWRDAINEGRILLRDVIDLEATQGGLPGEGKGVGLPGAAEGGAAPAAAAGIPRPPVIKAPVIRPVLPRRRMAQSTARPPARSSKAPSRAARRTTRTRSRSRRSRRS